MDKTFFRKDGKVDLRRIGKKEIDFDIMVEMLNEVSSYVGSDVKISDYDLEKHTFKMSGSTTIQDRTKMRTAWVSQEWDIKEYLRYARQYEEQFRRLEKSKERLSITSHQLQPLSDILLERSDGINKTKGLKNALATINKILKRDGTTGRNRLEEASYNRMKSLEMRYKAFDNPLAMMKYVDKKFNPGKYMYKNGKFKSKRLEIEFYLKFEGTLQEEDYDGSLPPGSEAELATRMYEKFVPEDMTRKEWMSTLSEEELVDTIRQIEQENIKELTQAYIDGTITDEEISQLNTRLSQYTEDFKYKVEKSDNEEEFLNYVVDSLDKKR